VVAVLILLAFPYGSASAQAPPAASPPCLQPTTELCLSVKEFGARGTARITHDGIMKAGSPILASSSSHFSAEDVAKPVYVLNAGVNGAPLSTTIVSILGTASALLAAPAATAVTNTSVTIGFDDTTSIQDAIAAVDKTGGGTVYIPAGFYRIAGAGGLTLEHSHIRLTGDGPNSILFESDLEYYPTTQTLAGGWSPHRLISVGISQGIVADVEIDHLQVQSNGDNWIQHSLGQSLIETSPTSDFEIDNFSLHDVTFTSLNFGLYSNGGRLTSFDISNNVMTEVAKEAIYLAGTPSSGIVSNNQISTDIYPSISNIGIEIKNGNNLQISANVIKGSFYTCIGSNTFPENYITVEHNQCSFSNSSNVADGIAFDHGTNISVINNVITGYRAYGITFRGPDTAISAITIVGNTVQNGNGGAAISVVALPADPTNGPAGITVSNNSLIDNASVGGIIELSNVQGDNTVTYNTIRTIVKMPGEALTISTMSASILACYGNTAVNYPLGDASCQW
jgi:hypothetical protein